MSDPQTTATLPAEAAPAAPAASRAAVLRKPPPVNFAAIDVGTNSIHLLMAEISPQGDFRIIGREKEMVQMGKGGFAQHVLTPRAMQQGLEALRRFVKMAQLKGMTRLRAVATSAVREAQNAGEFVEQVRREVGLDLRIISAEEEARLIYLAVRHAVDLGETDNLIVDVGGGSVEVIVGSAREPSLLASLKLGGARLGELFIHSDPPGGEELKALRRHIEQQLEPVLARISGRRMNQCIATSGTSRALADLCTRRRGADAQPTAPLRLRRDELKALVADLSAMNREQRLKLPGADPRRVDALLPAAMLLLAIMRALDIPELRHCDMALREGVILEHIATHRARLLARATWPDPRARSVIHLAERCSYSISHPEQVARLALELFDALAPLHRLDPWYRELLRYAALLHDIGYTISQENHHEHSYYMIRHGALKGFSEQEIEIIANIARYHRKGRPKKSHENYRKLAKKHLAPVRTCIAILRLANALDRTHYSVVSALSARIRPDAVDVLVTTDKDVELELWTARRQKRFLEKVLNRPIYLSVAQPVEPAS